MQICKSLAFTLAVTSTVVSAAPAPAGKIAIKLPKNQHGAILKHRLPAIMTSLATKFGGTLPPHHAGSFIVDADTETLTNDSGLDYWGPATVGSQPINLLFDTGSADLWVPGISCGLSCPGTQQFDPSASSTFQSIGATFDIQYGSGSAEGTTGSDTVEVGGVTVTGQVIGVVTSEGNDPQTSEYDGILGMGFSTLAADQATTWFENAVAQNRVSSAVFSFYLAGGDNTGSELYLGGANSEHYTGTIQYVPLTSATYWQFALNGISAAGSAITLTQNTAIADTGTSLIAGPTSDITAINNAIGARAASGQQGLWEIDCNATPGDVSFALNGVTLSLSASDYIVAAGDGTCISGFSAMDDTPYILGDVVLRRYYSVYDLGEVSANYSGARVGFAIAR
ncbi:hypothetical protein HKX48_005548 [Thoreauomyces humboldtii]|nr:hypothetical protein HKX48_005548 [Thoreauomyces humboldtii]